MPVEGEQSPAVDHTGDCNICMESPHWEEGMFIWYKEELGLGMVLVWAECCQGAFGGQVFVLLSCRVTEGRLEEQPSNTHVLYVHVFVKVDLSILKSNLEAAGC